MSEKRYDPRDKFTLRVSDAVLSQCAYCTRWARGSSGCEAFPGSIPAEILTNDFDHRRPWIDPDTGRPGDEGIPLAGSILFEPSPGVDPAALARLYARLDRLREADADAHVTAQALRPDQPQA